MVHIIHAAPHQSDDVLLDAFREHLQRQDLAPATLKAYLHDLKLFRDWLDWVYEGRPVALLHVQTMEMAAFRKHLIQVKNLRPATVNRRVQSLRLLYGWLHEQSLIDTNPALKLRFMRRSTRQRPRALRRGEVLALVRAAARSPHGLAERNTALVHLMLQAGLRVGEVAALRREDVEIKARSGAVRIRAGKGLKERELPLNRTAREALSAYLDWLQQKLAEQGRDGETDGSPTRLSRPEDPLFISKRGTQLTPRAMQKVVSGLASRAGIDPTRVSAHTLRHTFAVNYLTSNPGKLVELSSLLGHESLETTAVYTRPSKEDLSDDLERSPLNVLGQ